MPRRAALRFAISTFLLSTVWQPVAAGIVDPLMWKNTPSLDGAVQAPAFQARLNSDILAERLRSRADLGGIEARAEELLQLNPADGMARVLLAILKTVQSDIEAARGLLEPAAVGDARLPEVELSIARALIAREEGTLERALMAARRAVALDGSHPYAHNVLATVVYRRDGPAAALTHMERAAQLAPDGATYWANFGATLAEVGFLDRAQSALSRAVEINPVACDVLIGLGRLDMLRAQPLDAAQSFSRCLTAQPENPNAARGLAVSLIEARDFENSRAILDRYAALIPDASMLRVEAALRAGNGASAQAALSEMEPSDLRHLAVGRLALMRSDAEAALSAFEQVAETPAGRLGVVAAQLTLGGDAPVGLAEEGAEHALLAAYGYLVNSDPVQALAALTEAAYAVPGFATDGLSVADLANITPETARAMAGPLYLRLSHTGGAAAQLRQIAEANPDDVLAAFFAAEAAARVGAPSIDLLNSAARIDPEFVVVQIMRGNHFFAARDARGAFEAYGAAAQIRKDPDVLVKLGLLGETLGEDAAAEAAYRAFLSIQPDSYIALNQLAWFLAVRADDLSEATELAQKALAFQPGNAAILDTLGWIALRKGNVDLALERLEAATIAADGGAPEIELNLVEALIAAGQIDRARTTLAPLVTRVKNTPLQPRADALGSRITP